MTTVVPKINTPQDGGNPVYTALNENLAINRLLRPGEAAVIAMGIKLEITPHAVSAVRTYR